VEELSPEQSGTPHQLVHCCCLLVKPFIHSVQRDVHVVGFAQALCKFPAAPDVAFAEGVKRKAEDKFWTRGG